MRHTKWILLICWVILIGCTTFKGLNPVYPAVGNPNYPKMVDSLQPTFCWESSPEPGVIYDLIVYEGIKEESFWKGTKRAVGREVYYREGLKATEHKIEESLMPGTEYYWSLRIRRGQKVSDWSVYDYFLFLGSGYVNKNNYPFGFKTPKK